MLVTWTDWTFKRCQPHHFRAPPTRTWFQCQGSFVVSQSTSEDLKVRFLAQKPPVKTWRLGTWSPNYTKIIPKLYENHHPLIPRSQITSRLQIPQVMNLPIDERKSHGESTMLGCFVSWQWQSRSDEPFHVQNVKSSLIPSYFPQMSGSSTHKPEMLDVHWGSDLQQAP